MTDRKAEELKTELTDQEAEDLAFDHLTDLDIFADKDFSEFFIGLDI